MHTYSQDSLHCLSKIPSLLYNLKVLNIYNNFLHPLFEEHCSDTLKLQFDLWFAARGKVDVLQLWFSLSVIFQLSKCGCVKRGVDKNDAFIQAPFQCWTCILCTKASWCFIQSAVFCHVLTDDKSSSLRMKIQSFSLFECIHHYSCAGRPCPPRPPAPNPFPLGSSGLNGVQPSFHQQNIKTRHAFLIKSPKSVFERLNNCSIRPQC